MKLSTKALKKLIKEEALKLLESKEILNADTGEVLSVENMPVSYRKKIFNVDSYDALNDSDFESLRRDITVTPDKALEFLVSLAKEELEDSGRAEDLSVAIDVVSGFEFSYPREWKAALKSRIIRDLYFDYENISDSSPEDVLINYLAESI